MLANHHLVVSKYEHSEEDNYNLRYVSYRYGFKIVVSYQIYYDEYRHMKEGVKK